MYELFIQYRNRQNVIERYTTNSITFLIVSNRFFTLSTRRSKLQTKAIKYEGYRSLMNHHHNVPNDILCPNEILCLPISPDET